MNLLMIPFCETSVNLHMLYVICLNLRSCCWNIIHAVTWAPAYKAFLGTGQIPIFLHCCHDIVLNLFCLLYELGVQKGHLLTYNLSEFLQSMLWSAHLC